MAHYIFITLDALIEFASNKYFQSADFSQSEELCNLLLNKVSTWSYPTLQLYEIKDRGKFLYTQNIEIKKGLLFDLDTFDGFNDNSPENVITIFQKTVKYAVRYFTNQPPAPCDLVFPQQNRAIVFPFPFTATKNVDKVVLDINSTKQNRKGQNYLVAFYFGKEEGMFIQTNLNKAVADLNSIKVTANDSRIANVESLSVSTMVNPNYTIVAPLPFEEWKDLLTKKQIEFIKRPIKGAERLEGPAGSGKTLSLILRCIYIIKEKVHQNQPYKIIFFTHSISTKDKIISWFTSIFPDFQDHVEDKDRDKFPKVSILITTLQEWNREYLGANVIYDNEVIDKDASISKEYQRLLIEDVFTRVKANTWNGFEVICSNEFKSFINNTDNQNIVEMMQYEISVLLKGRAEGDKDKYLQMSRPQVGLPIRTEEDKMFMLQVYKKYQDYLESTGQFDTDDITISVLGQLNTPIWKRRSIQEGYDACFIDEAHLFNFNELSVFHYLTKPSERNHIIYVIDKSQYVGEIGFTDEDISSLDKGGTEDTKLTTIFRSSPDIVNLAFNILSSNVSLFSHFENPLDYCSSSFTTEDEKKCRKPSYHMFMTDEEMIRVAFEEAERYCDISKLRKSDILFVVTDNVLLNNGVIKYLKKCNKPFIELQTRNDYHNIKRAKEDNKYVVSGIDFVGGLEFYAVFIIGVDQGRVPPSVNDGSSAYTFTSYAWHNRMYVAISRSQYYVALFGNSLKGKSSVLETAIENKIIDFTDNINS